MLWYVALDLSVLFCRLLENRIEVRFGEGSAEKPPPGDRSLCVRRTKPMPEGSGLVFSVSLSSVQTGMRESRRRCCWADGIGRRCV